MPEMNRTRSPVSTRVKLQARPTSFAIYILIFDLFFSERASARYKWPVRIFDLLSQLNTHTRISRYLFSSCFLTIVLSLGRNFSVFFSFFATQLPPFRCSMIVRSDSGRLSTLLPRGSEISSGFDSRLSQERWCDRHARKRQLAERDGSSQDVSRSGQISPAARVSWRPLETTTRRRLRAWAAACTVRSARNRVTDGTGKGHV